MKRFVVVLTVWAMGLAWILGSMVLPAGSAVAATRGPVTTLTAAPASSSVTKPQPDQATGALARAKGRHDQDSASPGTAAAKQRVAEAAKRASLLADASRTRHESVLFARIAKFRQVASAMASATASAKASATAAVDVPGTLSGTVTDAGGIHHGLENVQVSVWSPSTATGGGSTTDANGTYTVTDLAAGTDYQVCFDTDGATGGSSDALGYVAQCYDNQPRFGTSTPVTVTAGGTTTGINAALVGGAGVVSGTVTDAGGTHSGLANVYVDVRSPSTQAGGGAMTDAGGGYIVPGLAPGTDYQVCFDPWGATGGSSDAHGYVAECYDNQPRWSGTPTPVTVTVGATTAIDAALAPGGAVSGTVTDAGGVNHGLANVQVNVWSPSTETGWGGVTDAAGSYTVNGLAAGTDYQVCFDASSGVTGGSSDAGGYVGECYDNQPMWSGTPVTVTAGLTTTGIDAALAPGGAISGTVTDAGGTHNGLANVQVNVWSESTGNGWGGTTAADGSYRVGGLAAGTDYQVCFDTAGATGGSSDALGYVAQCYNDQPRFGTPTPVTVTVGATTTGINAALVGGAGVVSGTVTDAGGTHGGLANVYVDVRSPSTQAGGGAMTDADGNYTVPGVAPGTDYQVCFDPWGATGGSSDALGYVAECYNNQPRFGTPTPVTVTVGATTGIDAALTPGGAVSGTVTDAGGVNHGLANVQVDVWSPSAETGGWASTDADGNYSVNGLAAGTDYQVCFDGSSGVTGGSSDAGGYVGQCYDNQPMSGTSTPVTVTAGATTTGIDAALAPGGAISGTVTDAGGVHNGLANVQVNVWIPSTETGWGGMTAADGSYTVGGLAAATDYQVCFDTAGATGGSSDALGYVAQCYDNQPRSGTPTPVTVTVGATTTGIDAALVGGAGVVSGTVTDAGGTHNGLANVQVNVFSASTQAGGGTSTDADGQYSLSGLAAATDYEVCFDGSGATGGSSDALGYIGQCYNNQPMSATPTPVTVTAGATTGGINAALTPGGAISGTVTDAGGIHHGLENVQVIVWSGSLGGGPGGLTAADGSYTVKGLEAGTDYSVCFVTDGATGGSSDALGYVSQCYNNQPYLGEPAPVTVTVGATTTGINAALVGGAGVVVGQVTDAGGTHHGLANVQVNMWSPSTNGGGNASTDADGSYSVPGLAPATDYQVCFDFNFSPGAAPVSGGSSDALGYIAECYNNQPMSGTPTPVTATAGVITGGINAALAPAGAISGTVTDAGGVHHGLANIQVSVMGGGQGATTAPDGSYTVKGLETGTDYEVCFDTGGATGGSSDALGYVAQCYNNQPRSGTPTPVTVTSGATTTGIDAALVGGAGKVSGTVTDAGGAHHGLEGVWVEARSPSTGGGGGVANTAADGSYTLSGLAPATDYQVCFNVVFPASGGSSDALGYVSECYNDIPVTGTPTPVTVTVGGITTGIDAALTSPTKLVITSTAVSGPTSATANLGPITVQRQDSTGRPAPAPCGGMIDGIAVALASSSAGTKVFSATLGGAPVTSVFMPCGEFSTTFYYGDTQAGSPLITASTAGLTSATQTETVTGAAVTLLTDFNRDAKTDLIARDPSGVLWLYLGNGAGGFYNRVLLATGWDAFTAIVSPGDVTGDGNADVMARDSAGVLWLYPGNGTSGLSLRRLIGSGWNIMDWVTAAGDMNGAGRPDLLARDTTGVLWLYPLSGNAAFGTRVQVATGWGVMTSILGPGDFSGDGRADVLARDAAGVLWLYRGNGSGGVAAGTQVSTGWQGMTALVTPGNWDRAGGNDLLARDAGGTLWLYPGDNAGGFGPRRGIGSGWNGYSLPPALPAATRLAITSTAVSGPTSATANLGPITVVRQDFLGNPVMAPVGGTVVALASSSSGTKVFAATLGGAPVTSVTIPAGASSTAFYYGDTQAGSPLITASAAGLTSATQTETITGAAVTRLSDFNRDGKTDLVARDGGGALWLYPGNGAGGFYNRVLLATGWGGFTATVTPGDVTGDGNADVMARDSAGFLWLYPGNGISGLSARRLIGSGWNIMDWVTSAGDMNGAGGPDLLARDITGALWLYPLSGNAVFGARVQVATGWGSMTSILGPGDFSGDGRADVLARNAAGELWLYRGNGTGGIAAGTLVSGGWAPMTALVTPGNWDRAGGNDLLARDAGGTLWLYPGDNAGGFGSRRAVGSGWNIMTYIG